MKELPDIIAMHLTILFVGYNPGVRSAETGHHFAGYSNKFWKLLFEAGITPRLIKSEEDQIILDFGCGITNIVPRPSRTAAEITKEEFNAGREVLKCKLAKYRPKIACYEGIGIYKIFAAKASISYGKQPVSVVEGVIDFVMPSPSGLNRMLFRDQLQYYQILQDLAQQ
jgi:double-stranded uracil-DNA glycosylase